MDGNNNKPRSIKTRTLTQYKNQNGQNYRQNTYIGGILCDDDSLTKSVIEGDVEGCIRIKRPRVECIKQTAY